MNNKRFMKISIVLILCTTYLFAFSQFGALAYNTFLRPQHTFPKGTMIGLYNMEGKTKKEAAEFLRSKVKNWTEQVDITQEYMGKKDTIPSSIFLFDIDETISAIIPNKQNQFIVRIPDEKITDTIMGSFSGLNKEVIDFSSVKNALIQQVSSLSSTQIVISIDRFLMENKGNQDVIAEVSRKNVQVTKSLKAFIDKFPSIEIKGNSQFSLNQFLNNNGFTNLTNEDRDVLASHLYELVLQTNFSIIERNQSASLPDNITVGYEAKIDPKMNQDFIFANTNKTSYTVTFKLVNKSLYANLKGFPLAYKYKSYIKEQKTFSPRVIKQYSALVTEGSVYVKDSGKDGLLLKMVREAHNLDGNLMNSEIIAEDFYRPTPRIEILSLQSVKKDKQTEDENTVVDEVTEGEMDETGNLNQDSSKDSKNEVANDPSSNSSKKETNLDNQSNSNEAQSKNDDENKNLIQK